MEQVGEGTKAMRQHTPDHVFRIDGITSRMIGEPDFSGLRNSLAVKLSAAPVRTRHHPVNAGHQPMSSSETRVSLIVGVCEQDPERWGQFVGIYGPMMMEYLRKQRLCEFDAKDVVQDVYVNACRVMKLVRKVCEESEEDMSHAFESDLS